MKDSKRPLRNKITPHQFTLEFLGTGTSQGVPEIGCECPICISGDDRDSRLRSSLHVTHDTTHIVVDTGPDFRQQALRAKIPRIDAVFYTHTHADHIMGVDDLRQFNRRQSEAIPIYLPRQFESEFTNTFGYAFEAAPTALYRPELVMHRLDPGDHVTFPGFDVQFVPVMHGEVEIAAFLFTTDQTRVAYVSECKSILPSSMELLKDLDVLIIGAIWNMDNDHPNHLTLNQALAVIDQLGPKQAYITHITHRMGLHQIVDDDLPETVHLSHDGLTLTV